MPWAALAIPVTVALLVALMWGSLIVQNSAAAYVGAESQWAQGEKSAVIVLYHAAAQHVPPDLAEFERALAVPAADRRARLELDKPSPDYALGARALVEGGSNAGDAPAMARLYPVFKRLPVVQRAVSEWGRGDLYLDSLRMAAQSLVAARGNAGETAILLDRVRALDAQLTQVELGFAESLGQATHTLAGVLGLASLLLGVGLATGGLALYRRAARLSAIAAAADQRRIEEFRALAEDAPDAIAHLDVEGRHVFANKVLARIVGMDATRLLGRTHAEYCDLIGVPRELAAPWEKGIAEVLRTREPVAFDVTIPSHGTKREFSVRLAPQLTRGGAVESLIAVGREVTEFRASARALRDRDQQLQQAQKIEAVGELAGGIAHDFNNILTAIIGSLELALDEIPELAPARGDVEAAIVSSRRATALTRQLLTFGRRQFVEASRVDLNTLVGETLAMLSPLVGERVRIETHLHPESIQVNADITQLQQVLVNLVVNARDAMPEGGTIVIETGRSDGGEGPQAVLTVTDTGGGMSEETRARVFEPFFTTKPRGQGTGLGLSIVHGIVAQSGGSVDVESTLGRGTTVRVRFPLVAPRAPTPTSATGIVAATAPVEALHGTVLLVEDEAPVRDAARRMLERAGHVVVEAQHAEDAVIFWRRDPGRIDVLVTDVTMPGMDGWTLLRLLREDRPSLPAVVMSGYTRTRDVAEQASEGAVTVMMSKPFGTRELIDCVQRAMEQHAVVMGAGGMSPEPVAGSR